MASLSGSGPGSRGQELHVIPTGKIDPLASTTEHFDHLIDGLSLLARVTRPQIAGIAVQGHWSHRVPGAGRTAPDLRPERRLYCTPRDALQAQLAQDT